MRQALPCPLIKSHCGHPWWLGLVACGSGGRPMIERSAVRIPAPPVHMSKCPWARHWTPNCSRWCGWCLAWFPPPPVYEWVNVMHYLCKAPWIKVLYKCTIYHFINTTFTMQCMRGYNFYVVCLPSYLIYRTKKNTCLYWKVEFSRYSMAAILNSGVKIRSYY